MSRQKVKVGCSPLRIDNIRKLRALRLTYIEIGRIYGVSDVQVHYWLNGRNPSHIREKPGACEICGRTKHLNHHHWGNPHVGMWLCPKCHMAAEVLDSVSGFVLKYSRLKISIKKLYASGLT